MNEVGAKRVQKLEPTSPLFGQADLLTGDLQPLPELLVRARDEMRVLDVGTRHRREPSQRGLNLGRVDVAMERRRRDWREALKRVQKLVVELPAVKLDELQGGDRQTVV